MKFTIEPSEFISQNTVCDGDFYLPEGVENPPVVVMAHGFAAERTFRLTAFAEVFAQRGLAAYCFDYRGFGKSKGKIRNYVSPKRHLQDWRAALAHVRKSGLVNPHKIALWGSSFSGGHVIKIAAEDRAVRGIVSQVPFTDSLTVPEAGDLNFMGRVLKHALRDYWNMIRLKEPHYIPAVAKPGSVGGLVQPGAIDDYKALVPEDSTWENKVPARSLVETMFYRPGFAAAKLACPALFILAEDDNITLASAAKRAAKSALYGKIMNIPGGHFDVYTGELFEKVSSEEADFLEECLA